MELVASANLKKVCGRERKGFDLRNRTKKDLTSVYTAEMGRCTLAHKGNGG